MNRYITVVHKFNNGYDTYLHHKIEPNYDVIRWDTERNEYVYGADRDYSLEHFIFGPETIEFNPYSEFTDEEFEAINKELLAVGDEDAEELATNENSCGYIRDRLTDKQFEIIEKYRKMLYDRCVQECKEKYNNDFTIENDKLRKEKKERYEISDTPTFSSYYDEDEKLYRIVNGSAPEVIHDSRHPEKVREELIDN